MLESTFLLFLIYRRRLPTFIFLIPTRSIVSNGVLWCTSYCDRKYQLKTHVIFVHSLTLAYSNKVIELKNDFPGVTKSVSKALHFTLLNAS